MKSLIKNLIFTVLIVVLSAITVCADRVDTGWKGYGLYNLNNSDVTILNESDTVTVNGSKVIAVYEYTIRSNASNSITVNFGYPDNGITKFSVHDGSKYLSYKTRLTDYLKTNYGTEGLQTPDGRWFLFNMAFTPGQTRTIKVSIEAEMKKAENDTYGLGFFKDRSYKYAIAGEKVQLNIEFADFKPYMIFDLEGIKPENISEQGTISISGYGNGFSMNYQPVDKMAIERLSASEYKKPKAIVKAFNEKKYNDVLTLCDEYINAPSDNRLSLEQVKFVKAEALRLLNNNQEYIRNIEQLDISKLYPGRIRYKVLLDRLEAYRELDNSTEMDNILKELIPETQQGYPYLYYWLSRNGFELAEEKEDAELPAITGNTKTSKRGIGLDILDAAIKLMTVVRNSHWSYAFLGLVAGFILGRLSKRSRRRKSVYLFRD